MVYRHTAKLCQGACTINRFMCLHLAASVETWQKRVWQFYPQLKDKLYHQSVSGIDCLDILASREKDTVHEEAVKSRLSCDQQHCRITEEKKKIYNRLNTINKVY